MKLRAIFPHVTKPIIGMLHLPPLPGSYNYRGTSLATITALAMDDARALVEAGFDGLLLQNANDRPPSLEICPEKIAYMSVIGSTIRREYPHIPMGTSVTWNVPKATVAVAHAIGGQFVRLEHVYIGMAVTPYGLVRGVSYETTLYLKHLEARHIQIFADVYEAHSVPLLPQPIAEAARQALGGAQADAVLITGKTLEQSLAMIREIKQTLPQAPVLLAGGSRAEAVGCILQIADGIIVGTALKEGGRFQAPVSPARAREYMDAVRRARGH
jgi:hypothetical protein